MTLGGIFVTILIIAVVWSLIPLMICSSMAGRKGKSRGLWILLAIIFGWIAVLFLAIAAPEH
jgi:hypothetical protein